MIDQMLLGKGMDDSPSQAPAQDSQPLVPPQSGFGDPGQAQSGIEMPDMADPRFQQGPMYTNPGMFRPPGNGLYPSIFSPNAPPSGWFTMNDFYRNTRDRNNPDDQGLVDWNFQAGASLPSTNDWRLLPPQWRDPNYFMVNGEIIDRNQISPSLSRNNGQSPPFTGFQNGALAGYPIAFTNPGWSGGAPMGGYPGSMSGWHLFGSGTT